MGDESGNSTAVEDSGKPRYLLGYRHASDEVAAIALKPITIGRMTRRPLYIG